MSLSAVLNRSNDSMIDSQFSTLPALAVASVHAGSALAAYCFSCVCAPGPGSTERRGC